MRFELKSGIQLNQNGLIVKRAELLLEESM